jgi:hypothetical protein
MYNSRVPILSKKINENIGCNQKSSRLQRQSST